MRLRNIESGCFKTVNGMEACVTLGSILKGEIAMFMVSFKTVNGMEACVTSLFKESISLSSGTLRFQNRKRYGGMRDRYKTGRSLQEARVSKP